jgi:diguanylate cyclase (GGDEF)-like protein/PAS domain S-box-containing protein
MQRVMMLDLTVLIVDDDNITTTILSRMLDSYIKHIHIASNGEEGLETFLRTRPDIVLSDINMPKMGGLEMVSKIREIDPVVKVAIFTNFDNKNYLLDAIRYGVNQFFSKPFQKKHFTRVIGRLCDEILEKRKVQAALRRQQNILHTINNMAEKFLQQDNWRNALMEGMVALKSAAEASALFIFKNDTDENSEKATKYLTLNDNPLAGVPDSLAYKRANLMRWKRALSRGNSVSGLQDGFDRSKRKILDAFAINSMLIIPIFTDEHWWGFMGIGNDENRPFDTVDIETLDTVARMIGSALTNQRNIQSLEMTSAIFKHTVDGVLITNAANKIVHVNGAFAQITGYSTADVLGKDPKILKSGTHDKKFYQKIWNHLSERGYWQGEIKNRKKNGEIYIEWLSINAIKNAYGEVEHHIGIFSDVTTHRSNEAEYARLATHDPLTGLNNRLLLNDRLEHAIMHARRFKKAVAVVFCDLDNFKPINDTYGHSVGDIVLQKCAQYFKSVLRSEDTICRYGGDEFVFVLEELEGSQNLVSILEKIMAITSSSFLIGNETIQIQMSAGVSLFPDDDENAASLIQKADEAMYQAKRLGKNRVHYFSAVEGSGAPLHPRLYALEGQTG